MMQVEVIAIADAMLEVTRISCINSYYLTEGYMAVIKNRRRGPDTMVKMITYFSILTWFIIGTVIIVYTMVNPAGTSGFMKRGSVFGGGFALTGAKLLLFINLVICVIGMFVNMMRNKRRSDKFRISLIISTLCSLVGFILFMTML